MVTDDDEMLLKQEIEDFKIFNRRLPTLEEEGSIWERIQRRKLQEEKENKYEDTQGDTAPNP